MNAKAMTAELINTPSKLVELDGNGKDIYSLHGELYWAYREAVGNKLIKAAYHPDEKRWYTWLLWLVTIIMFSAPIVLIFVSGLPTWATIIFSAIWFPIYMPIATFCINRGLRNELISIGAKGNTSKQPPRLVKSLLHHLWFSELVKEIAPTDEQINQCIEFADNADQPINSASYFKHPLVLVQIGIVVFMLNSKLTSWGEQYADKWLPFFLLLYVVALVLYVGWLFHSKHTNGAKDNWRFKRCLKWYLLNNKIKTPLSVVGKSS